MKRRRMTLSVRWRVVILASVVCFTTIVLLVFRLQSLAPRLSSGEQATLAASMHPSDLLMDASLAPIKLLYYAASFGPNTYILLFARLPSIALALLATGLMAFILRRWYGPRSMLFGIFLFITSAWFLHVARFAGWEIGYLTGMLGLLASQIMLADHEEKSWAFYLWLAANMLLLFIPGFVWFILLGAVWHWRAILGAWRALPALWHKAGAFGIVLAGLALPAYTIVRTPTEGLAWLAIPDHLAPTRVLLLHLRDTALAIFYRGPHRPELWLGQLPILDLFVFVMFIAGVIFYVQHWRATRAQQLASYLVLGIVLASLGVMGLSVFVPLLYIVAVGGIAYVLHLWLKVFPRNPLARGFGIGMVATVIALSCIYGLMQYFVAWPHNPEVRAIYSAK